MTAREILSAWDAGESQHPIDRALTMLQISAPADSRATLAALSIGARDHRLLALREEWFGPAIDAFSACPACTERIEYQFRVDDILVTDDPAPRPDPTFSCDEWTLDFRLPDSRDLAAIVGSPDRTAAEEKLAARCLRGGRRHESNHAVHELPDSVIRAWRENLGAFDPQADVHLDLACPACAHQWSQSFDIAEFLWVEISAEARRLLREVDSLARAYGWSEKEILDLGAARRRAYLEMIAS